MPCRRVKLFPFSGVILHLALNKNGMVSRNTLLTMPPVDTDFTNYLLAFAFFFFACALGAGLAVSAFVAAGAVAAGVAAGAAAGVAAKVLKLSVEAKTAAISADNSLFIFFSLGGAVK
jgi:hypothetical protein